MMSIEFAALSDVGRKRDHNEDRFISDEDLGLFVLCDGMGGHAAGEVAADLAANTVHTIIREQRHLLANLEHEDSPATRAAVQQLIETAVQTACAKVFTAAREDRTKAGMGTTLELVLVARGIGFMGHVGDSRLYMKRAGEVHQLSEDHSFVREMVRAGTLTEEQARHSAVANVITRAVGIQETVKVDTLCFDILPGDTLLLCSDGLSDYLEGDEELAQLLDDGSADSLVRRLVDLANERGGKDNITTLLIRCDRDQAESDDSERIQKLGLKLDTLKRVRLFKHLSYKELMMLLGVTELQDHPAGVTLISENDLDDDFYIVLRGRVSVVRRGHRLAELGPGDHFGEMEVVTKRPRSASVTTLRDTALLVVRREELFRLMKANEHLAVRLLWSFLQTMSVRLYAANLQLSDVPEEEGEQAHPVPF